MGVALLGEGDVYATGRGTRFHEVANCRAMQDGLMIDACRCGDMYCGCFGETPDNMGNVSAMSIGDAAMKKLIPCTACYPSFQELAAQLPADEDFGHRRIWLSGDWFCRRCRTRWVDEDGERSEYPTVWPCVSARVLALVSPAASDPV